MKILQVLNHFLPQQTAGTEVYVWALSKQLQLLGNEVDIIIPNYGSADFETYEYDGLQIHKYPETSVVDRALQLGFKEPQGLKNFKRYIIEYKPDLIHFHELAGGYGITLNHVLTAKKTDAKVIFTFHLAGYTCKTNTLIYNEEMFCDGKINIKKCSGCYLQSKGYKKVETILNPISQLLYVANINTTTWNNKIGTGLGTSFLIKKQKKEFDLLIDHCDKVIVLTKWYEKILLLNEVSSEKIEFIPQGLPQEFKIKCKETSTNIKKPVRIIFLGRVSYLKGLHLIVEALLQLPPNNIILDIYGQEDGTDYQQKLKQKSLLCRNITWRGKLEPKEVLNTMQQYDVLCLCSTFSEMSPLVIQEAFAAGIPVLASDVYGNAEQIRHNENGWLFKFKDVDSLKLQIQQLIENPSLIEVAKQNIKPVRTFDVVAKEQLAIYEKLLKSS